MKTRTRNLLQSIREVPGSARLFFCTCLLFLASASGAGAASIGPDGVFLVDRGYDYYNRDRVNASLVFESEDAYFYFEDQYYDSLSAARKNELARQVGELGGDFDYIIYPTVRKIFGGEWNPGIDDDRKLVILFTRLDYNIGGYFNPNDEYAQGEVADARSNEREMIYLNPDFLGSGKVPGFLSHEFQHMIYWNEKTNVGGVADEVWINEARSELASSLIEERLGQDFAAGTLSVRKRDFLTGYADSVASWNNANRDYATASIFAQYLRDHFGTGLFRTLNLTRRTGMSNLDYVLRRDESIALGSAFTNWTLANYINDTRFDVRYGYENEDLKHDFNVAPVSISDKDGDGKINLTAELENWSGGYYKLDLKDRRAGQSLEVTFDGGDQGDFAVAYVINYANSHKEVGFLDLNSAQDGGKYIPFPGGDANSIVFIPNCQKLEAVDDGNQVRAYALAMEIKLVQPREKALADGTLVKLNADDRIYLIEGGLRRWITDAETFNVRGFDWKKVVVASGVEMSLYPSGENLSSTEPKPAPTITEGMLVQGDGPRVYLIENQAKRWIPDAETFAACGYGWNRIVRVGQQELLNYADGESVTDPAFSDGTLIRGKDSPKIYVLMGGLRRWITGPEAFNRNGFDWGRVVEVSAAAAASYRDGKNIE